MAYLPPICLDVLELWTARVPLISWRRVEWHLPDRVMRQFAGIQHINIPRMESGFERIDGRGRGGDYNWMMQYANYIVLWNDRYNYIITINPPRGDGKNDLKIYMQWYKSWATIYLLRVPTEPPSSYYPNAPNNRLVHDYIINSGNILGPLAGGRGENASSMQLAIDEVVELHSQLSNQLHLDIPSYNQASTSHHTFRGAQQSAERMDPPRHSIAYRGASGSGSQRSLPDEGRRHSAFTGFSDFAIPFTFGGSNLSGDWASTSQHQVQSQFMPMSSSQPVYSMPWMPSVNPAEYQMNIQQSAPHQEDDNILPEEETSPRRNRRPPSRYTPSDAIPPRRRRQN